MSYVERARRYLDERQSGPQLMETHCEISEISEIRGDTAGWWTDRLPESPAPILHLPPAMCIAPSACSRISPCDRHAAGEPCQIRNGEPA